MADNGTVGRVHTMMCPKPAPETPPTPPKGDSLGGQIYNESASVVGGAWDGLKQTATTLKEATGIGVNDCVASAARDRIVDGMGDAVKGLATLSKRGLTFTR